MKAYILILLLIVVYHDHQVTWYRDGHITATGSRFNPKGMTCAVRNPDELRHWVELRYNGREVYCYANDLLPPESKAEYDLTPAAFQRLAQLSVGRLHDVEVRVDE